MKKSTYQSDVMGYLDPKLFWTDVQPDSRGRFMSLKHFQTNRRLPQGTLVSVLGVVKSSSIVIPMATGYHCYYNLIDLLQREDSIVSSGSVHLIFQKLCDCPREVKVGDVMLCQGLTADYSNDYAYLIGDCNICEIIIFQPMQSSPKSVFDNLPCPAGLEGMENIVDQLGLKQIVSAALPSSMQKPKAVLELYKRDSKSWHIYRLYHDHCKPLSDLLFWLMVGVSCEIYEKLCRLPLANCNLHDLTKASSPEQDMPFNFVAFVVNQGVENIGTPTQYITSLILWDGSTDGNYLPTVCNKKTLNEAIEIVTETNKDSFNLEKELLYFNEDEDEDLYIRKSFDLVPDNQTALNNNVLTNGCYLGSIVELRVPLVSLQGKNLAGRWVSLRNVYQEESIFVYEEESTTKLELLFTSTTRINVLPHGLLFDVRTLVDRYCSRVDDEQCRRQDAMIKASTKYSHFSFTGLDVAKSKQPSPNKIFCCLGRIISYPQHVSQFVDDPNDMQKLTFSLTFVDEKEKSAVVYFEGEAAEKLTGTSIADWQREGIEIMGEKVIELLKCCTQAQHVLYLRLMSSYDPPSVHQELPDSDKASRSNKRRRSLRAAVADDLDQNRKLLAGLKRRQIFLKSFDTVICQG